MVLIRRAMDVFGYIGKLQVFAKIIERKFTKKLRSSCSDYILYILSIKCVRTYVFCFKFSTNVQNACLPVLTEEIVSKLM